MTGNKLRVELNKQFFKKNMYKKKYRPIHQLPYCCVPATLQWILYRRRLDILDQETIGVELGLQLPERFMNLISNKKIIIKPNNFGYFGTQIEKKNILLINFLENLRFLFKFLKNIVLIKRSIL